MQFSRRTRCGLTLLSLAGFILIQTPLLAADAPAAASSSAPKAKAPRIKPYRIAPTQADVQYGPSKAMVLDFWKAKSETPAPLVVYIHGGGFRGGDKSDIPNEIIEACLNAGVSFMTVNYRFLPEAPIQDIMRDCARSIQFVRHNAKEYGIDKKRIASFGGSAGAGTSVWLAFHDDLADPKSEDPVLRESTRIVAAGSLNGQATYDLVEWEQKVGPFKPEWTKPEEAPEFYHLKDRAEMESEKGAKIRKDCSMLGWASKDDPAVFIFCSQPDGEFKTRDHLLHHPKHATVLKERCDAVGIPVELFLTSAEPRSQGNPLAALGKFLFSHLGVGVTARK